MKIIKVNKLWLTMLLTVLSTAGASGQEVLSPENPPEPLNCYKVTVSVEPAGAGFVSGQGSYYEGQTVNISTSAYANYQFLYWKKDGVQIDQPTNFSFDMGDRKTSFVAVYGLAPVSPNEPTSPNTYRL